MRFIKRLSDNSPSALSAAVASLAALGAVALSALAPLAAFAQAQTEPTRAPEANLPFLFAVYIITWAAFFAYIFYVSRRQREMQSEIEALKRALEDREPNGGDAAA